MVSAKTAEGRQQGMLLSEMKTGKSHRLPALTLYTDCRMHMSAEKEFFLFLFSCEVVVVVDECERFCFQYPGNDLDSGLLVKAGGQDVVIAFHKPDIEPAEITSPFAEKLELLVRVAVEHIADHHQCFGPEKTDGCEKPVQVFKINSRRYTDARFTEVSGFAEMQVAHQQGLLFFPEDAVVGTEHKVLTGQLMGHGGRHAAKLSAVFERFSF
jgi:hypothetical protein